MQSTTHQRDGSLRDLVNVTDERHTEQLVALAKTECGKFQEKYCDLILSESGKIVGSEVKEQFALEASPMSTQSSELGIKMETWVQANPEIVRDLVSHAQELVLSLDQSALPGHDARHVIVKDTVSALAICNEENLQEYQKLFLIPSVLHDIGKFVELRNPQLGDRFHAEVGFLLTREMLDSFSLPEPLQVAILDAVLSHSKGFSTNNFMAQAVQRADREQLIGPEMVYRNFVHGVGILGRPVLGDPSTSTIGWLDRMMTYTRNLYPQVGTHGEERADKRKAITAAFVWLAASDKERQMLFAPELKRESSLKSFSKTIQDLWTQELVDADENIDQSVCNFRELHELFLTFVTPAHAVDPRTVTLADKDSENPQSLWDVMSNTIANLDYGQQRRLTIALRYILREQAAQDSEDTQMLGRYLREFAEESVEHSMAEWLKDYLKESSKG